VDRNNIKAGECVNFSWKVDNVKEVYFYREGQRWQDHGVTGEETRTECPPVTTTYYLRVVKPDNSVEVRQITIYVEPTADAPFIKRFTVDPPGQITLGQCVQIRWNVQGQVNVVTLTANGGILWGQAPTKGTFDHCPDTTGSVAYGIEAVGPGGTSRQVQTINVVDAATATPVPTAAPEAPTIHAFSLTPNQITAGECTGISWSVGGGTSYSRILRNGVVIVDDAGFSGQQMDCLDTAGGYTYRLEAFNPIGESVSQEQIVNVTEAAPENPLAGTNWTATVLNGASVIEGTSLTASFGANGSLNGSSGCNSYSATYTVDSASLIIGPPGATGALCAEPEGIMEQEAAFLAALQSTSAYSLEGGELYLIDATGAAIIEFVGR
jgi:heat shock protein HslJ